uniref:Uncharacterized protein n=1 Tax=Candidatus Methanophagaceae archaeon ANME-1 ERB6 TaxID=2759912 RepID=A0A7G9YZF1_9EURY|nr:hypothetical protein OJFPBHNK_00011 [Methanosarcinales archaeon ANME-1 ERB6]
MLNGPSGSDEGRYHKDIDGIISRLSSLSRKQHARYVKTLLGRTGTEPEIDEDIHDFFHDLVVRRAHRELRKIGKDGNWELTSEGALEYDVNSLYSRLSGDDFLRYGGKSIREEMRLFLLNHRMWGYGEIASNIYRHLTCEERRKVKEGRELYLKKLKTKTGETVCFPLFDKHTAIVNDQDRWIRSFKSPEEMSNAEKQRLISEIRQDAHIEKGRELAKKQMKYEKPIRGDWLTLLREIYSIKYIPEGKEFLKRDSELQKIWGIPRKTWKDKMKLLSTVDKDL